jgi:D-3-phosphoglycerate dehydrogenase
MPNRTVVVTDHDFEDLSTERETLGPDREIVDLTEALGAAADPADAVAILRDADPDAVLNLRYDLGPDAVVALADVGCRIVARYGIGVDNVAVDAAVDRGLYVTNVPGYCDEEVATHAMSMLLALARRLPTYDASVADGGWDRDVGVPLHRLSEATVGVVGFGAIGRTVGKRAAAFDADVLAADPFLSPADVADHEADLVALEELLDRSDYVSVHSPLTDDTRGLFDADAFERMPDHARLINVARGPIVDDDALHRALDAGEIAGAGLDVFPDEPPATDDPLRTHDRVLATPHVAWYSEEANAERRRRAAEAVEAALAGDRPDSVVAGPDA